MFVSTPKEHHFRSELTPKVMIFFLLLITILSFLVSYHKITCKTTRQLFFSLFFVIFNFVSVSVSVSTSAWKEGGWGRTCASSMGVSSRQYPTIAIKRGWYKYSCKFHHFPLFNSYLIEFSSKILLIVVLFVIFPNYDDILKGRL